MASRATHDLDPGFPLDFTPTPCSLTHSAMMASCLLGHDKHDPISGPLHFLAL